MTSQRFYILNCDGIHPIAKINNPVIKNTLLPWTSGEKINTTGEQPIVYQIDASELDCSDEELEDQDLKGYQADDFNIPNLWTYLNPPLICKKLTDIITSFEHVNIELFEAEVINSKSGTCHNDYFAFNLLQIAEDEVARQLQREVNQRTIRVHSELYPVFYLYADGPLIVNEAVKYAIEKAQIDGVYFELTSDYGS